MWTETTRKLYERKSGRYATDLTDGEWAVLEPLLPVQTKGRGRPRQVGLRDIVDALLYLLRSGCPLAVSATGFSTLYDGSALFLHMACEGSAGEDQSYTGDENAGKRRSRSQPFCGCY